MTSNQNKIVTLIPARGGSKGIPKKNLIDINGRPLISYTIQSSLESIVDETWVSSEDQAILEVSSSYGANVLERPFKYATDEASSESVLMHFADNVDFDILVFLQATSPMTTYKDINDGIIKMDKYDSVISVSELTQFTWNDKVPSYDLNARKRRQDCDKVYLETGALFITKRDCLLQAKNRISGNIGFLMMPRIRSFDIDTYDDLELVRKLMR